MSLWRLELLRLTRTNRWLILVGVYGVFGVLGPVTAAYLPELIAAVGGGIEVVLPEPTPLDGLVQYLSNVSQLGVLAVIVVAASALAVDARPEAAAFYRTRITTSRTIVLPRYVLTTLAAALAFALGTALAWAGSELLLGSLPAVRVVLGMALGGLYLAVVVAVVAAAAAVTRGVITTVLLAVVVALALPIVGLLPPVKPWLPSELVGASVGVVAGEDPGEYLRASLVSVVTIGLLLWAAVVRQDRREL